jgi:hypothetical protein
VNRERRGLIDVRNETRRDRDGEREHMRKIMAVRHKKEGEEK